MSHFLPPALLAMFAPRPPLAYKPPLEKRGNREIEGISEYVQYFLHPSQMPPPVKDETPQEVRERKKKMREERNKRFLEEQLEKWDPKGNPSPTFTDDAYKTLFVGRLAYDVTESELRHIFEEWGPIKKIVLVKDDVNGKPRGYAFIEYESSSAFKEAYKRADGKKIHDRRILVDVERGRTVKNWRPRRLGGGLGGTRIGAKEQNITHSGRYVILLYL
eukprot:TRINITY_DN3508_c0_g1_i3.p1 TRINITY_DN3508_c0_g1~~TRINITY_DN3508_c0_g1_i3.p1  ORF type:complete len:218 (-),score=40.53 TRINITY_DN3508_c0_g1_i3:192-845(-)